ncbi:hypothetical protein LVR48_26340, partial [Klebsiella pneumoniae]|nr:hypothetical protein [Klebsiella pneumoniae]
MLWRTSEKQTISYNIASEHKSLPWSEGSNLLLSESAAMHADLQKKKGQVLGDLKLFTRHCCKVSDEAAFCLIQRPYISKTLLT